MMRNVFFILAILCALAVFGAWWATGADTGWTKTQIAVMQVDPVTGLEFPDWENRLILGIEFLVLGLIGSAAIGIIGVFIPKQKNQTKRTQIES